MHSYVHIAMPGHTHTLCTDIPAYMFTAMPTMPIYMHTPYTDVL